nr:hypothetical protein GTC16762_11680 [Pigmentibacter ruber]
MNKLNAKMENVIKNKIFFIPSKLKDCYTFDCEQYFICKSPFNTSMFNIAWLKEIKLENVEQELAKIINIFKPLPFALWTGPNSIPHISGRIIYKLGFQKEANEVGMYFDLNNFKKIGDYSNSLSIIEVKNKNDMQKFISILEEYDPFVREYYLNITNELDINLQPFRYFCLMINDEPACIASVFFYDNFCGIFDVLTKIKFQKNGYAFSLMQHILTFAKNFGSSHVCLTASSLAAVSLYTKLGFKNLGNYECYEFNNT